MSLYEENEKLFEMLEEAEGKVEKIKINETGSSDLEEKKEVAWEIKALVSQLVDNIAKSGQDIEALGGAIVLVDLLEVLKRYKEILSIPNLETELNNLEEMWEKSR